MDNYKGLYYNESKEQRFYEAGAHFSYEKLFKALLYLKEEQDKKENFELQKDIYQNSNENNNNANKNLNINNGLNSLFQINDLLQNNNNNSRPRTRNVANTYFNNHPNTQIKNVLNKNNNNKNLSIGISCNKKKYIANSRNYANDYNLFYNRTTNLINNDTNLFQDTDINNNNKNNLYKYVNKKVLNKNNSTNQIKNEFTQANYLYNNNLNKNIKMKANKINEKNIRNDSYIIDNNNKIHFLKANNNKKIRKINTSSNKINKINNLNINNYINNGENNKNKKRRTNSGTNGQMSHSINNYINLNINNNNNINVNINNITYQNNKYINDINSNNNKQTSLNQVLMSLIKANNNKNIYKKEESKEKEKEQNKNISSIIFGYSKNNKSRNANEKWGGMCHVKSMDYNKKKLNTELLWNDNNTFYDKTFNDNNNNMSNNNINNNNCQVNMSTLGNKLNWNYSRYKMKDNNKIKNISFYPVKNNKGVIYKDIIKKFNSKNINNQKKIGTKIIGKKNNPITLAKYNNMISNKYADNEILSKYIGYFKKINKK